MRHVFHLLSEAHWRAAEAAGRYEPESLRSEGFVHCSTRAQLLATAHTFYAGRSDLLVLCLEVAALGDALRFEGPAGGVRHAHEEGALFPHYYGPLPLGAVRAVLPLRAGPDGRYALPEGLPE